MSDHDRQSTVFRLWITLAAAGLVVSLIAGTGCRKKEDTSGAVYYEGPIQQRGPAPVTQVPDR